MHQVLRKGDFNLRKAVFILRKAKNRLYCIKRIFSLTIIFVTNQSKTL